MEILNQADPTLADVVAAADWVRGWRGPLHECLRRAMRPKLPPTDSDTLTQSVDGFFEHLGQCLDQGQPGPTVSAAF